MFINFPKLEAIADPEGMNPSSLWGELKLSSISA